MIKLTMKISTTSIKFEFLKMRSCYIFFMIVIAICDSEIDRDQNEYLMSEFEVECGKLPGFSRSSSSRIINGMPAAQAYPWIADVVSFKTLDPTKEAVRSRCGGSLISDRVVLTAGHCVCNGISHPKNEEDSKIEGIKTLETCLKSSGDSEANQNQKGINEIHVMVGKRTIDTANLFPEQPEFDSNLHAYLHKYVKPDAYDDTFHTFSKNGDIAAIVNNGKPFFNKFDIASGRQNIVPICLPSPDAFNKKNGFRVKTAARGGRYEASRWSYINYGLAWNIGNRIPSTCTTNEGTMPTPKSSSNRNFLPCKSPQSHSPTKKDDIEYCSNYLQDNDVNSFSIHDELELTSNGWTFKNDNYKKCNDYYPKAKESYAMHMAEKDVVSMKYTRAEFDEKVERFKVKNKNDKGVLEKEVIETCYNVKALGRYGICQIDENNSPNGFQWGFCSRTCRKQILSYRNDEPYEEAMFDFYDIAPTSSLFSKQMTTELQYIYKCIKSIIPRASTFSFSRTLRNDWTPFFTILNPHRDKNEVYEKLEYEEASEQDDENNHGSQHVIPFYGDSGSPYWKYDDASNRAVVVSIHSSKVGPKYGPRITLLENPDMQCNHKATKLTEEVVLWIKQKAGIKIKKGQKRSHPGETSTK